MSAERSGNSRLKPPPSGGGAVTSGSPRTLGLRNQSELDLLRQQCLRLRELLNWLDVHRAAFAKVEKDGTP